MRRSGRVLAGALRAMSEIVRPGISTADVDRVGEDYIRSHGGSPSFHTTTGAEGTGLDYLFAGGILYGTGINRSFVNGEERVEPRPLGPRRGMEPAPLNHSTLPTALRVERLGV